MGNMTNKKNVRDIAVKGKRVLVRCDFNVPMENGKITDDTRIMAALPTIEYLSKEGARVILVSHFGRPKGTFNMEFSLAPVGEYLAQKLGKPVIMAKDVVGEDAKAKAAALNDGDIMLLENVRFEPGEEKNDTAFSKELASLAEVYVNDAFGTAHRAHASTAGVAEFLPAVAGFLMQKEVDYIGGALQNPKHPMTAIIGGAKVSDKIGVIENLLEIVDTLVIGGAMAYTFQVAKGEKIGTSRFEEDKVSLATELMTKAAKKGVKLLLPVDHIVSKEFDANAPFEVTDGASIPDGFMALDIGPKTIEIFKAAILASKTIIWNGPMGVFEMDNYATGTLEIGKAVAEASGTGATSIVGGGDSVAAVTKLGLSDKMSHISTGGGATLEFLEGKELPGVACLLDA